MSDDAPPLPQLLTVQEVAELCRLSERAVYRAVESGELPGTKLRSRLRIRSSDLDAWINEGLVGQQDEYGGHAPPPARTREEHFAEFKALIESDQDFSTWKSESE